MKAQYLILIILIILCLGIGLNDHPGKNNFQLDTGVARDSAIDSVAIPTRSVTVSLND